ncbi:hypothetical protein EMIT0158MI4_20130 [Burkholderia ambifaria]
MIARPNSGSQFSYSICYRVWEAPMVDLRRCALRLVQQVLSVAIPSNIILLRQPTVQSAEFSQSWH